MKKKTCIISFKSTSKRAIGSLLSDSQTVDSIFLFTTARGYAIFFLLPNKLFSLSLFSLCICVCFCFEQKSFVFGPAGV